MKDVETLLALGREIARDPEAMIHAIEKHIKVRNRNGEIVALAANPAQTSFEAARDRKNIVLKARQMGITTWVAARFFMKTITTRGALTVQVAHTREAAEGIFRMVQRFWEYLPDEWREGPSAPLRRSRANIGQMCFPELDSEFRIVSAGDPGAGRGLSIQNLHLSEVSRWPGDATETLAGLLAALAPAGELVIESTPNGAGGCFYDEWNRAEISGTVQHFFPWWLEPAYVSAAVTEEEYTDEERTLTAKHSLSPQQVGFRRSLESSFHGLRVQEYAEDAASCFLTSGDSCFDAVAIERRLNAVPEPIATRRDGTLIWLPPLPGRRYILGVDTAGGGVRGDYSAIQVIERVSGLQCAELQHRMTPMQLAKTAAAVANEYNNALIAVERNNHGAAVLAHLENARYANLYTTKDQTGWLTSLASKPVMIARLNVLFEESPEIFYSARLLKECRTYINLPSGSTGAASGSHDDCVMAMGVAQAVRAEMLTRP
jgi:hypothetical protein